MPKTSRKELTEAQIGAVLALFHAGLSQRKIHSQLGIPRSTIQYTINRFKNQEEGPYLTNSRPGRPPILNEREKRHLIRYVNSNPFENLKSFSTPSKSGHLLHRNTTRKYLNENEIYAFKPVRKPYLSKKHKADRLIWARRHRNWGEIDWACVDYGDEAIFEIGLVPQTHVWRPKDKAYESKYLQPTFKSGRSFIGVWGAISWN